MFGGFNMKTTSFLGSGGPKKNETAISCLCLEPGTGDMEVPGQGEGEESSQFLCTVGSLQLMDPIRDKALANLFTA